MLNILTEPLIRMDTAGAGVEVSLPEIFAALMQDEVNTFPALRPHQRHAWHAFLVQLGVMALRRAGRGEPPENAAEWVALIRGLTPDYPDDEPWQVVVNDITEPAFMQPPASADKADTYERAEEDKKNILPTPDKLDMLVTSKNHDLKSEVATEASVDAWLFALITLQTTSAQNGRGNYSVSRLKSAYSGRPAFSLTPSLRPGAHARRDIIALLERMDDLSLTNGDIGLLWTIPWDGTKAEKLPLVELAPYYIEVCRRVRLRLGTDGKLSGLKANSDATRIEAEKIKGRTGDPWTPINTTKGEALNIGPKGFTYDLVKKYLISADWEHPVLLKPTPSEQHSPETMQLVARSLKCNTRKQGMTEGYHERIIPIRSKARTAMLRRNSAQAQELGDLAQERIEQIGTVKSIVRRAIATFAARGEGDKTSSEHRTLANPWSDRLDAIVDARFFDDLQTEFEADNDDKRKRIRKAWLMNRKDGVIDHARRILQDATATLPCPAIHRYRARVKAEGLFEGRLRRPKGLPFLFDEANKEDQE